MRLHRRAASCFAFAALVAASGCSKDESDRLEALETFGELPTFSLTDQSGAAFGSTEILGNVTIVNFIFTRCPTVCPIFTRKFANLQKDIGAAEVLFVSISVDPEHDTPKVLADYAAEHDANPSRWKFLTGDPELIKKTAEDGLKLALERKGQLEDGTPDIVHASHFVLIDREGTIRGYYDSDVKERRIAMVKDAVALASAKR